MAFDVLNLEMNRKINYDGIEYRVIEACSSGMLIVAKDEDVINKNYPLQLVSIPESYV